MRAFGFGEGAWETFRRAKCGGLDVSCGTTCWDDLWDDLWQRSMPAPDAAARHTGAGVARRQAHHERMRDERRSKETKAKRRKRTREDARAALDGHTVLPTGSRLEIFCDSERRLRNVESARLCRG